MNIGKAFYSQFWAYPYGICSTLPQSMAHKGMNAGNLRTVLPVTHNFVSNSYFWEMAKYI